MNKTYQILKGCCFLLLANAAIEAQAHTVVPSGLGVAYSQPYDSHKIADNVVETSRDLYNAVVRTRDAAISNPQIMPFYPDVHNSQPQVMPFDPSRDSKPVQLLNHGVTISPYGSVMGIPSKHRNGRSF